MAHWLQNHDFWRISTKDRVKYRIHIGKPLYFKGEGIEDDEEINAMVQKTKDHLQEMINQGLSERKNIFF